MAEMNQALLKVCTWISEDYEQCQMPYVKSSCDYSQEEADQVVVKVLIINLSNLTICSEK